MGAPPWTNAWDESKPADADLANTIGIQDRQFKLDVRQRMAYQHVWNKDVNTDGAHINIVLSDADTAANTELFKGGGYSLTGANAQSALSLAGTWNTSGSPTAIKLNITNTASGAAALLLDLQIGGTSKFAVSKLGQISFITEKETVIAAAFAANNIPLDLSLGNHFYSQPTANVNTMSLTNIPASGEFGFSLELIGDGTARTYPSPWFTGLLWPSGIVPTPTSTNNKRDRYVFITRDGGTTWLGATYGQNFQ